MRLRLSRRAVHRLTEIGAYLRARSPSAAWDAQHAIRDCFDLLVRYPEIGRRIRLDDKAAALRVVAAPRWPYLIYYQVDPKAEGLTVVTIRHAAQLRIT